MKINDTFVYVLLIIFFNVFQLLVDTHIYQLIAFTIFILITLYLNKFDFFHPQVMFPIVFWLFSISFPILLKLNKTFDIYEQTHSLMFAQNLALSGFLIGSLGSFRKRVQSFSEKNLIHKKTKGIVLFLSVVLFFSALLISRLGSADKADLYDNISLMLSLSLNSVLLFLAYYSYIQTKYISNKNKMNNKYLFFSGLLILLLTLYTGERDFFLRFILINFLIYFNYIRKGKFNHKTLVFTMFLLLLPSILKTYKYYFMSNIINKSDDNIMITILSSDFQSASKNLQITLLGWPGNYEFLFGKTIFFSVLRAFSINKIMNIPIISSTFLYNQLFFKVGRSGQGFSLVADAFINFSYPGIFILFVVIGYITFKLYSLTKKSFFWVTTYILYMLNFLYAIRGDFATYFTGLTKQSIFLMLIIVLIEKLYTK